MIFFLIFYRFMIEEVNSIVIYGDLAALRGRRQSPRESAELIQNPTCNVLKKMGKLLIFLYLTIIIFIVL